jgi:hypothetical protein
MRCNCNFSVFSVSEELGRIKFQLDTHTHFAFYITIITIIIVVSVVFHIINVQNPPTDAIMPLIVLE